MDLDNIQVLVDRVVKELPMEFRTELDNVEFMVEDWPTQEDLNSVLAHPGVTLYGLYRGIPKTKRGQNYNGVLPDKIIIFAGPIWEYSSDEASAINQIRQTVLHEIGHYFGLSEKAIRRAQKDCQ